MLHSLFSPLRQLLIQKLTYLALPLLAHLMPPAESGLRLGLVVAVLSDLMLIGRQISKMFPKDGAK